MMTRVECEKLLENWARLKDAFSEDFQRIIEKEWNRPFVEVFGFLSSRSKRQLSFIVEIGQATELLCFELCKIAEEQS